MKRPAEDGGKPPVKKLRTLPPIGQVADEDQHVFISLQGCSEKVDKLFAGGHRVVFIRGGVAIGKTTLAEHLARQYPEKYVIVPFTDGGTASAWEMRTVEAIRKSTGKTIKSNELAFGNALKLATEMDLTLVYDEAHTLFSSQQLCTKLFKSSEGFRAKVLLLSASGDSTASSLTVSTPNEITQKFMWTPPLSYKSDLQEQLKEAGVRLDRESIEFFIQFCGGHRGIFIAAMHWVKSNQTNGESWNVNKTVGVVRNSYSHGQWDCSDTEILGALKESRAVKVNGRYSSVEHTPKEFVELLCAGARPIGQDIRRELTINGFVLPKYDSAEELQKLNWTNDDLHYKVANPLLAAYYRFQLKKTCGLQLQFWPSRPENCADLLMRALPYLFFSKVVSFEGDVSQLGKGGLPHEQQYNQAILSVLTEIGYKPFAPQSSKEGDGKPDLMVNMDEETFVMEGAKGQISEHLERFKNLENYKIASHKGLYIISNNNEMLETVRKTEGGDVQVIGLVPNIAHTAYTVHVKSKGIKSINTFTVDCDLVARRLVLKDDGKPELYSVQSLKSVSLSQKPQSRRWARSLVVLFLFCLSCFCVS